MKTKKKKAKVAKAPSKKSLIKKLDDLFSVFIRRRYADKDGFVKCYTCDKAAHWKEMQCGHFASRKHFSTRWDNTNCRVQCVGCNVFKHGNMVVYAINLIKECGPHIIEELNTKSKQESHFSAIDYQVMIDQLKEEIEKLDGKEVD